MFSDSTVLGSGMDLPKVISGLRPSMSRVGVTGRKREIEDFLHHLFGSEQQSLSQTDRQRAIMPLQI